MTENLTKKQQKALAFRAKQKGKKSGKQEVVPEDVPEQDLVDDNEVEDVAEAPATAEASKKRKSADAAQEEVTKDVIEGSSKDVKEKKTAKAKGKGKAKNAWEEGEDAEGDAEEDGKKSKKEIKQRFILFVGNLGFKTTREEVQAHFTEAAGNKPAVRLLTTKADPKSNQPPKSRGIAFLELPSSAAMQACLKLHHSLLQGRRINVELTAGGGGKSEGRQEKIKSRNERVGGQRERRAEREKEAEGEASAGGEAEAGPRRQRGSKRKHDEEPPASAEGSSRPANAGERQVEVVRADGEVTNPDGSVVKIRGGRRVKAKAPGQSDGQRDAKRTRYDGHQGSQGGDRRGGGGGGGQRGGAGGARAGGYQNRDGGRGFRPKWEPTGANAVQVG